MTRSCLLCGYFVATIGCLCETCHLEAFPQDLPVVAVDGSRTALITAAPSVPDPRKVLPPAPRGSAGHP